MELISTLWEWLREYLPALMAAGVSVLVIFLAYRLLERRERLATGFRFVSQLIMLGLSLAGLATVLVALPIPGDLKGQLLGLFGILISATIALSSTTFLGNALAGLMLRVMRNFRMGDFIRAGDHFGRVSERGLFHTEIQTENRDLITLPNFFLVTHPVTTIRTSGTIVASTVSLGYDVPRKEVEKALLEAAEIANLQDPFVQVKQLGDFSVSYRIAGMLTEVKQLLTARSTLRKRVLDRLHEHGIEIVSPSFMNTRALPEESRFIPDAPTPEASRVPDEPLTAPEDIVFDKAEEAESLESLKQSCDRLAAEMLAVKKQLKDEDDPETKEAMEQRREALQVRVDRLKKIISRREEVASKSD